MSRFPKRFQADVAIFALSLMKFCRNKPPPEPLRLRSAAREEGLGGGDVVFCNDSKPVRDCVVFGSTMLRHVVGIARFGNASVHRRTLANFRFVRRRPGSPSACYLAVLLLKHGGRA